MKDQGPANLIGVIRVIRCSEVFWLRPKAALRSLWQEGLNAWVKNPPHVQVFGPSGIMMKRGGERANKGWMGA